MKKTMLAVVAGAAMLAAGVAGSAFTNGPTGAIGSSDIVVRSAPAQNAPQQAPAPPSETKALREERVARPARTVRYHRGIPASIKNRTGGELAHRKWRKAKSSGRHAA